MPETASQQTTEGVSAQCGAGTALTGVGDGDRQGGGVDCVSGLGVWFWGVVVCVLPLDMSTCNMALSELFDEEKQVKEISVHIERVWRDRSWFSVCNHIFI